MRRTINKLLCLTTIFLTCEVLLAYSDLDQNLKLSSFDYLSPTDLANLSQCSKSVNESIELHKKLREDYICIDGKNLPIQHLYSGKKFLSELDQKKKLKILEDVCKYFIAINPSMLDRNAKSDFNQILAEVYHATAKVTHDVLNHHFQSQAMFYDIESNSPSLIRMKTMMREELQRNYAKLNRNLNALKSKSFLLHRINQDNYQWPESFEYQFLNKHSVRFLKSEVEKNLNKKNCQCTRIWSVLPEIFDDAQTMMLDEVLAHAYQHLNKEYQGSWLKSGLIQKIFGCFIFS
ncbi:MAG: F-box protein [Oligoflexales bacterium]